MSKLFDSSIQAEDKEYQILRDDTRYEEEKNFLESLWSEYGPYADSKECIFIHNPKATRPLPKGWLRIGLEFWLSDVLLRRKWD